MPEVLINGPEGRIEARYAPARRANPPIAVVLHPDPRYGGTMNSKVTYALFHVFVRRGFSTLRFNFRGVGRSQGTFDGGEGELSDAASALDWLQSYNPNPPAVWVAGFSFGAWIGMQLLMRRPEIDSFVSVAPPANLYDFTFLAPCPSSGLVVQGDDDDIVNHDDVEKLVSTLRKQRDIAITLEEISGADHYFTNHMQALVETVDSYLGRHLDPMLADVGT